jgi:hypothetical protein
MATAEMLRPYIEQKIATYLGIQKVEVDSDGDIPIKAGSAVCYARLFDGGNGPVFRVFSPLLLDVPKTEQLLERLNELNQTSHYVRFFWQSEQVFCSTDVPAENLLPDQIENSLLAVSWHADKFDDELKAAFGGRRMLEDEDPPTAESEPTGDVDSTPQADDSKPDASYL